MSRHGPLASGAHKFGLLCAGDAEFPGCIADPVAVVEWVLLEQMVHGRAVSLQEERIGGAGEVVAVGFLGGLGELYPKVAIVNVVLDGVVELPEVGVVALAERINLADGTHLASPTTEKCDD